MTGMHTYHLPTTQTSRDGRFVMYGPPAPGVRYDSYPAFSFVPGTQGEMEPVRYGLFILDLDCKADVMKPVRDARTIVEHVENVYGIGPEVWRFYLSGAKGVHLYLPAEVLGTEAGHLLLPLIYKRLALELTGQASVETIDASLYCMATGRPFRLPNRRRENGFYKVPITFDKLCEISDAEDYMGLCSAPRPEPERITTERNKTLAEKVADYVQEAEDAYREKPEPINEEMTKRLREVAPPCIDVISRATRMPKGKPTFNDVAMQLVAYAVTVELPEAKITELCEPAIKGYPSPGGTPYNERLRDFKTKYRHMKAHDKGFSCGGILSLGFAGFDCNACKIKTKEEAEGAPATEAKPDRRFKLVRAGAIEARPPRWVVRGWLEEDALALVFGDPGCGKSFWALDLALCIATGTPHHDHCVKQGPVIYIAGEGQNGIKRRLMAWSTARGVDHSDSPLFISLMPTALTDEWAVKAVLEAIDGVVAEAGAPALVVVDTLARNYGAGDENSTSDMNRAITAADAIRAKYRATLLLVHHSGHADKTRARGAMALKAALDAEYRMDRDESGTIRLEATKMKEAEHPEPLAFRLLPVDLDLIDPDTGEIITGAALELTSFEPRAVKGKQGRGKHQTRALEILMHLWSARPKTEGEAARITLDAWKLELKKDCSVPRKKIGEVVSSLYAAGAVAENHGFVSPVF